MKELTLLLCGVISLTSKTSNSWLVQLIQSCAEKSSVKQLLQHLTSWLVDQMIGAAT
jgi:hypothetical protein